MWTEGLPEWLPMVDAQPLLEQQEDEEATAAAFAGDEPPAEEEGRLTCTSADRPALDTHAYSAEAAAATNGRRCVGSARTDGYTDDTRAAQRPVRATSSVGSGRGVGRGFVWLQPVLARRSVWRSPRCAGAGGGAG